MMNNPAEGTAVPLIRAGTRYGFLIRFDLEKNPDTRLAAPASRSRRKMT